MCAGAIVNSRIDRVVYAAPDLRAGAFGSVVDLNALPLNHKPQITGGICCEESKSILSAYFRAKRRKKAPE
jgi:tRNA(adenine34) deaminase